MLLYLYLLHVFLPLLFLHWVRMVSVFWTLWFHCSISKSLSSSWGLGQLATQPAPSQRTDIDHALHRGQVLTTPLT